MRILLKILCAPVVAVLAVAGWFFTFMLSISAAVLGTESSDREPFQPEQCLDVHTSLAASTATGRDRLASGDPADVVLLDADPYAADTPEAMRAMPQHVVMTLLCGERTY